MGTVAKFVGEIIKYVFNVHTQCKNSDVWTVAEKTASREPITRKIAERELERRDNSNLYGRK